MCHCNHVTGKEKARSYSRRSWHNRCWGGYSWQGYSFLKHNVSQLTVTVFSGKKKSRVTLGNPQAIDADGLLMDVDVQSVDDNSSTREDKRQDVDHFFRAAVIKEVNGKSKRYRSCKICPCVLSSSHQLVVRYPDFESQGAIRVLSMKLRLCDAILRHVMRCVMFVSLFSSSNPSPV